MRLRDEEILDLPDTVEVLIHFLFSYLFSKLIFFIRKAGITILFFVFVLISKDELKAQQVIGSFPTMDGGFEAQSGSLANTSIAGGVQRTDWTSSSTGTTVNSTGGRSGPKYITFNKNSGCTTGCGTGTHIRIQSPTAALGAITASTSYTIQFYYKINATSATTGGLRAAISDSGTVSMGSYTTVATNISNTNWVKAQVSASTNSNAPYYGLAVIDPYFSVASTLIYDFDDFVVYAGAADNTAPGDPTAVVVNGATTSSLNVSWTAPAGGVDGGGYLVVRYATNPNADNDPNQNGIYAVGNTINNGTGSLTGTVAYIGTSLTFTDNGLSSGTTYYYKVYAVDKAFNYSVEASGNATTVVNGIISAQSGNWYTGSTWVGGVVPASNQNAIIAAGHTVTIDGITTRDAGTSTTVNGILATNVQYINNGTTTINGSFQLNAGGYTNTGNNFVYGANGTLIFNNTSSYVVNSTDQYWPTTNGPFNVTILQGGMTLNAGAARTVPGLFQTASGVTCSAAVLTLSGTCQINSGGFFNQSPTYGASATLVYNTSPAYGVYNEWTGNSITPGVGIPKNVTVQNAGINLPATSRGIGGNININAGTLTLSATSGADLYIGGNWTRSSAATFTPSNRAVFFNGSSTQVLTVSGGGTETFNYLLINGTGTLQLATGTNVTVNTSSGLSLSSTNAASTIDLNGQTLTISGGGNLNLNSGNRIISSAVAGGVLNITSNSLSVINGGALLLPSNVTTNLSTGMAFGSNVTTIQGVLQIYTGGSVTAANSPVYTSTSTLIYNGVSNYGVNNEWTGNATTSGNGTPQNVTLTSSSINMPNTARALAGSLTIGNSSVLNLNAAVGADLNIGGNWNNQGTFNCNQRLVQFRGTVSESITGATIFDYLTVNNSLGVTLQASTDITIRQTLNLTSGVVNTGANKTIIASTGSVTRTGGWVFGNLQKYFQTGTAVQQVFEIGNSLNYLPDTIWANVDVAGSLLLSCTDGDHPNIATSQLSSTKSINRYWSLTNAGATISSYDASFNFLAADVDAGANPALFQSSYYNAPDWVLFSSIVVSPAYFRLNGSTLFGNIAVGESKTYLYYRSLRSGSWTSDTTWQVCNDNVNYVNAPTGFFPDAVTANVIIQNGHTVLKTDKNPRSIKNLTVNAGGSLFAASTVGQPTYISLYGSILCNGNIGTGVNDSIAFNIDGVNDTISGTGTFKCQRMRKNALTNLQTNLVIGMNVTTGFGASSTTSVYNNGGTSFFNITVKSGFTLSASSLSIDGIKGLGAGRNSGTYSIYGTLNISDTLFATTDNGTATYSCNIVIYNGGLVNAKVVKSPASGLGKHTISIQNGGRLNITGAAGFFQFSNVNNVFDFQPGSTVEYSAAASQTIESGIPYYDNLSLTGSGNKTPNGDLNIRGNWSRTLPAVFDPSNKAVFFNGKAGNQTITITGAGGAESFAYLIVNKPSVQSLQLNATPATDININGGLGGYALQLQSGNLDLNGRTCIFYMSKNGNNNNIAIDDTSGSLARNINSSVAGGLFRIYNQDAAARFTMIRRLSASASTLNFNSNVTLSIGGVSQNSGVDFGPNLTYINNIFRIDTWGYVEANAPFYGNTSTLIYNSGGNYKRYLEWSALNGAGYPNDIIVQNNTLLRVNDDNIPVNNNGNGTADRAMAGSFTISAGASVLVGDSTENNKITIGKDFNLNGTINMPSTTAAIGADLYIAGNWNRSSTGVFNHNERAVFFNSSSNSTITASGGQYFPYLYLVKASSTPVLTLADNISIGKEFTVSSGTFDPAAKDATLLSNAAATARFGPIGISGRINYSGSGRFIVERYLPVNATHGKSWQFLAVPTNGGQTVKQAWQEGATLPNQNPVPGYGTQLTSNLPNAVSLGFDVYTAPGPSIKTYANGLWTGIPNTTTTPIYNPAGYMVFVRGSRSDTTVSPGVTSTILRSRGKVFDPIGNPTPSVTVAQNGYTSIGNPYASSLDFSAFLLTGPGVPDVDPVFYVWDPLLGGAYGYGGYQTISANNGDFFPTPGGTANYPTGVRCTTIQSGQAFLMRSTLPGLGGSFSFNESMKTTGSRNTFRPVLTQNNQYLRMYLQGNAASGNRMIDGAVLAINPVFSNEVDYNDAQKLANTYENLAIQRNGIKLSLEARKNNFKGDTVFLALSNLRRQDYRFAFAPDGLSRGNANAYLVDQYLHVTQSLSTTDSSFANFTVTTDPGSYASDRFYIVFGRQVNLPVANNPANMDALRVSNDKGGQKVDLSIFPNPIQNGLVRLRVTGLVEGDYNLVITDCQGRMVDSRVLQIDAHVVEKQFNISAPASGIYSLTISGHSGFVKTTELFVE